MAVYYVNLLLILGLAFPLCIYKPNRLKKMIYVVLTLSYMWLLATFRQGIGYDYYTYIEIFEKVRGAQGISGLLTLPYEWGFILVTKAMTWWISSPTVMYAVYALMVLVPIGIFVYRHCKDPWLSLWLYVTLTFFYTSMNFVRQSIACSIIVLGYGFLRDKKIVKFLLIVILAALFHKTALIMIPVCFLCYIKLNKKWGVFYGAATVLTFIFSKQILDLVTLFIFTSYHGSFYTNAFPLIFLVIPFALFGGCLALWPVWRKRQAEADMLLNLMMYSAIIWLFITRHFILERFSMYIYVFVIIAVPQAVSALKCSQEDYDKLAEIQQESGKKSGRNKAEHAVIRDLSQKISDHQKYYWSGVVAVLILTMIYQEFGSYVNGFHRVFPYRTSIVALQPATEYKTRDDGTQVTILPDGTEIAVRPDGTQVTTYMDNTKITVRPDGTQATTDQNGTEIAIHPDGTQVTTYMDNTQVTVRPDGTQITTYVDGRTETVPAPEQ